MNTKMYTLEVFVKSCSDLLLLFFCVEVTEALKIKIKIYW